MTDDHTTSMPQSHRDPQDQAFGAAAARDEDRVDELDGEGMPEEEFPDEPELAPRAAAKAQPGRGRLGLGSGGSEEEPTTTFI